MSYNLTILITANRKLPEFNGYEARTYPGTPSPRRMKVEPRRHSLPSSIALDWEKMRPKKTWQKPNDHLSVNHAANIRIVVCSPSPPNVTHQ